jgi:hypothetical protein
MLHLALRYAECYLRIESSAGTYNRYDGVGVEAVKDTSSGYLRKTFRL